jgi:hypothetical protein
MIAKVREVILKDRISTVLESFTVSIWEDWGEKCETQTAWDVEERRLVVVPWQCVCTNLVRCEGIPITCPLFLTLPTQLTWSPTILYVFHKIKLRLKEWRFVSFEEVQAELQQILNTLTPADFNECFQMWQNRWDGCIQAQCDNFEGDDGN